MPEIKWIKITTTMFEDEKIDFIESLPEADAILVVWIKLLTMAGRNNSSGFIFLTEKIPYTTEMLAHRFRRPLNTVKLALETLKKLGMIDYSEDGLLKITNWEKHQNIEGMKKIREQTRKRVANYRERQKALEDGNVTVTLRNATELELELESELDIDKDIDLSTGRVLSKKDVEKIITTWNSLPLQPIKSINPNTKRHSMLKARINEYSLAAVLEAIGNINKSDFLKGANKRSWIINFDWFVRPNNFIKVFENNYINPGEGNNANAQTNAGTTQTKPKKYEGHYITIQ